MKLETMLAGCVVAGSLFANGTNVWNVADFGAREADTLQTEAIQRAIDACFTAGGGEVRVPEGVYYTGGIRLRSRVTLHLMSGAVLKGSRNPDDYEGWRADTLDPIPPATAATNGLPRSSVPQSRWCNGLIRAYGAHDIAIIGEPHSVIDGQNCFDPTGEEKYRGPHAISMWYCTNVVLRGYTVCDSANWAHAIFNSSNIAARALKVMGGHDGFDVRTCDDVRVESCVFQTGDDGIAGFDNIGVVVRDCVLDSACSAFRFGGTDVLIENCRGTGPAPYGFRGGLPMETRRQSLNDGARTRHNLKNAFLYYCDFRAVIRRPPGNILMRNCTFTNPDRVFSLDFDGKHRWCCNRSLNSITFENCTFDGVAGPLNIHGDANEPLTLTMRNCTVTARPGAGNQAAVSARNFRAIRLENTVWKGFARPRVVAHTPGEVSVQGGTPLETVAGVVVYPEYPAAIARDAAYAVQVEQEGVRRPLVVYNHCEKSILAGRTHGGDVNRRFCEFAFSGAPVRVDIRVSRDVSSYKVFPARHRLKSAFRDGVVSVWLDRPVYFGIQLNDSDKTILSVFADAPEKADEIPQKGAPGVLYVEGWVDAPGADGFLETPKDLKEIYLAPGAVLNARLKIVAKGLRMHGRGMVLDPLSDIFRYDQTQNTARGVIRVAAPDVTLDGFKVIDARTFNLMSWAPNTTFRNVKLLASMMCSDGFTNGHRGFRAENCWLYVGDNALVVSGVTGAVYRDIAIGTSCAAIFPQGDNAAVTMENIDVFRADDGLINNWYNETLRRNNKWSEMNAGKAHKEKDPQDLRHLAHEFFFRNLSAVDCTLFSHFFSGHNMGTLPKTFAFDGCSVPGSTGRSDWRAIGKTDGVAIDTRNDPKRWLVTDNYALTFTNLWIGGVRSTFPASAFNNPTNVAVAYATTDAPPEVPLAADRHVVTWKAPVRPRPAVDLHANLVAEAPKTKSVWQRVPSWLVKLEATHRDEAGRVIYRLVQCEKSAGMQAVVTDGFLARGNGRWTVAFDLRARSENPFSLRVQLISNEKTFERKIPVLAAAAAELTPWKRYEVTFDTDFDPVVTDLVAVSLTATDTADEIAFRNLSFSR